MAVFKETTIYTEEQKASVFYEANSIILSIAEYKEPTIRLYLNNEEAKELAKVLLQYSGNIQK